MNREELQKVHDALSLLNSMVNCGDQHSPTSVNMTQAAFAILRKPLPPAEGAVQLLKRKYADDKWEPNFSGIIEVMTEFAAQQQPTAEGAEAIKQALCDDIEKSLNSAKMKHLLSEDGEFYPFVDFMSTGDTIAEGREEIENIVEQIYFDMDSWPSLATLHAQRIADKMVSERCKNCNHRGLPDSINEALNSGDGVYRP